MQIGRWERKFRDEELRTQKRREFCPKKPEEQGAEGGSVSRRAKKETIQGAIRRCSTQEGCLQFRGRLEQYRGKGREMLKSSKEKEGIDGKPGAHPRASVVGGRRGRANGEKGRREKGGTVRDPMKILSDDVPTANGNICSREARESQATIKRLKEKLTKKRWYDDE